jgi:hypothetical protein
MRRLRLLSLMAHIILSIVLMNQLQLDLFSSTCTVSDPCNACKNCRYCRHCAKEGGKCGVCK